jgi:hypothetical protein
LGPYDEPDPCPRPGPDYVEKVRQLGLLAVLLILGWALAGYPAIHGHAVQVARRLINTGWPYLAGWVIFAYALWELALRFAREPTPVAFPWKTTVWLYDLVLLFVGLVVAGIAPGLGAVIAHSL